MNTTPPIALDQGWKKIKTLAIDKLQEILDTGIEKVQTNTSRLFTPGEYSNCYTTLYNMCTQKHPHNFSAQMYERHGLTISSYLERSVRPALDGISGPDLLEEMTKRWKNHQIMNKWMENFFMYLDRYYVSYHYKDALKKAGMMKFKEIIFDHVKSRLTKSITDMIEQEREGIIINRQVIMNCVSLYEAMGMNSLDAYTLDFEQPLLEQTSLYYKQRTTDWLATDSTPIYLEKIENALNNEKLRVESYLNQETESKLLRVIETVGLEYHLDEIIDKEGSGCIVLLANDKVEDLARMYRMFLRLEDKLGPMADRFQKHVESLGFALIEKRMSRFNDTNTSNESKSNDKHVASSSGDGDNKKSKSSASVEKESNNDPEFVKDLIS